MRHADLLLDPLSVNTPLGNEHQHHRGRLQRYVDLGRNPLTGLRVLFRQVHGDPSLIESGDDRLNQLSILARMTEEHCRLRKYQAVDLLEPLLVFIASDSSCSLVGPRSERQFMEDPPDWAELAPTTP